MKSQPSEIVCEKTRAEEEEDVESSAEQTPTPPDGTDTGSPTEPPDTPTTDPAATTAPPTETAPPEAGPRAGEWVAVLYFASDEQLAEGRARQVRDLAPEVEVLATEAHPGLAAAPGYVLVVDRDFETEEAARAYCTENPQLEDRLNGPCRPAQVADS